jgi:hypothetical protein
VIDAVVFRSRGESWVSIRLAGQEIDVAGPFDDEADACMVAERAMRRGSQG